MTVTGTVLNGVVVFDPAVPFADGEKVVVSSAPADPPIAPPGAGLLRFIGALTDMPADFAEQHDHYIHGTPKR